METMEDLVIKHSKTKRIGTLVAIDLLGIRSTTHWNEEKRNVVGNHYMQALIIIREQRERLEFLEEMRLDYLKVTQKIDEIIRMLEKR